MLIKSNIFQVHDLFTQSSFPVKDNLTAQKTIYILIIVLAVNSWIVLIFLF